MPMIRLYEYWRSSASYRVRIALNLAGLEWQTADVDLTTGQQREAAHLRRNPQGLVPVLEVDGHVMTQSLAIVEYLNETRHLGLLPDDPLARARARSLAYAIAIDVHPICNIGTAQRAVELSDGWLSTETWMQSFIFSGLRAFEEMLGEGPYCAGEALSMADLCLMPQLYNARRWGVEVADFPKILAIETLLNQHPEFIAAHPDQCQPAPMVKLG